LRRLGAGRDDPGADLARQLGRTAALASQSAQLNRYEAARRRPVNDRTQAAICRYSTVNVRSHNCSRRLTAKLPDEEIAPMFRHILWRP
jgi:hypothetical protein